MFINLMDCATLIGSSLSTGRGRPVITLQKPQERVQILPKIIKVAVPAPQHSPIFGQFPLSQIVCKECDFVIDLYGRCLIVFSPQTKAHVFDFKTYQTDAQRTLLELFDNNAFNKAEEEKRRRNNLINPYLDSANNR